MRILYLSLPGAAGGKKTFAEKSPNYSATHSHFSGVEAAKKFLCILQRVNICLPLCYLWLHIASLGISGIAGDSQVLPFGSRILKRQHPLANYTGNEVLWILSYGFPEMEPTCAIVALSYAQAENTATTISHNFSEYWGYQSE